MKMWREKRIEELRFNIQLNQDEINDLLYQIQRLRSRISAEEEEIMRLQNEQEVEP